MRLFKENPLRAVLRHIEINIEYTYKARIIEERTNNELQMSFFFTHVS